MKKIRIYLIARISKDAHNWSNEVISHLGPLVFEVFKPHEHNPWNLKHETFPKEVFDVDLAAMKKSHIGLCLPEFGKDCSWECGWYGNSKKPLVVFVDDQITWLRDWMIKGGLDYVVTTNRVTYRVLTKDPILRYKQIILIDRTEKLNMALEKIYRNNYKGRKK